MARRGTPVTGGPTPLVVQLYLHGLVTGPLSKSTGAAAAGEVGREGERRSAAHETPFVGCVRNNFVSETQTPALCGQ